MSHHSGEQDGKMSEIMERFYKREKIGPTDEGELKFAVFATDGKVVIDFNSPVHWIGMNKEQAQELAGLLIKYANKL